MAYLEQADPKRRAVALIGVGSIHTAVGLALVVGLTVTRAVKDRGHIESYFVPVPAPPPPPTDVEPTPPPDSTITAPQPPRPIPSVSSVTVDTLIDPIDTGTIIDRGPAPNLVQPTPTPSPSFAPRGVVPRGRPAAWIATYDYPGRALRSGDEGLTGYRLIVASDGKVSACEITKPSGSADLDRETCRLLARRAQFEPATDSSGARVVGTYGGSVRWDIPD